MFNVKTTQNFAALNTDARYVNKYAQKVTNFWAKMYILLCYFLFLQYSSLIPRNSKMQLKLKTPNFVLQVIIWCGLCKRNLQILALRQLTMSLDFSAFCFVVNMLATYWQHTDNMLTSFPTNWWYMTVRIFAGDCYCKAS